MTSIRPLFTAATLVLLSAGGAAAQDAGGIGFPTGVSAANVAQAFAQPPRMPVFTAPRRITPPGAMVTNPGVSRKQVHQQQIAKIRGDAGFLAGFNKGQPLAASRQPPPEFAVPSFTIIEAPFIFNNFNGTMDLDLGAGGQQGGGQPGGQPDAATGGEAVAPTGPAPVVPFTSLETALVTGGVTFNNVNSAVNIAAGTGNVAVQSVKSVQK
ncbi:MAG TPA: hypothetical protein VD995_01390 [Azospirillum sp.]|nr:hypothetical protein [Azospirillum sp.]